MKNIHYALTFLLLCSPAPSWAATAHDFFPICAAPPAASGQTLIVDPSGAQKGSYPNLAAAQKVAKPGDRIDLMTGDYGELALTGMNQNGFITIEAAPGQTPKFSKLLVGGQTGASHWRLAGLTVSGFSSGKWANGAIAHKSLVFVNNSDNIIFEHDNVQSQAGRRAWRPEADDAAANETLSDGIGVDQSFCVSIVENHLSNLFNTIQIGGDQIGNNGKYYLVSGNVIDNFAGDGIDHVGSHVRIENNHITNGHDICENKCIHTDGIQGWTWHNKPVTNTDVVINGNVIIAQTEPGLVLPADDLHGITIFDGRWDGVQVTNNLIITDTWHGITIGRAINSSIVNNTVAGTNPARNTWIGFAVDKNDSPDTPYNFVIRNNVAPSLNIGRREASFAGVTVDHNLKLLDAGDFADNFVKFDPEHFAYDMHPSKKSDAKGEGSAEGAPAVDIDGQPRKGKIDIGAYAYQGN